MRFPESGARKSPGSFGETKHECSGRFRRSRSIGLRKGRAQRTGRPDRQHRGPPRTAAADVLSKGHLRDHRHRLVLRQHGPWRVDLRARLDQADVPAFDRRSGPPVQLELPRHVRGRSLCRPPGGPLRPSQGFSGQHDLLGPRQPRLRPVIDSRHARRLASVARLRHGHGISRRAIHGVGDHPGRTARPLHRLSRRLLAARLHCLGPSDLCCVVGRRLALGIHPAGDPGAVRAGDPPLRSGIAAAGSPPTATPSGPKRSCRRSSPRSLRGSAARRFLHRDPRLLQRRRA